MKSFYLMNMDTAQMFDEIEAAFGRQMTLDDMEVMSWAIYQSGQTIPAKLYSKALLTGTSLEPAWRVSMRNTTCS